MQHYILSMLVVLSCVLVFIFSASITWLTRIYAVRKNILDIPNERSSHHVPIPRGGGIAIVLTFTVAVIGLGLRGLLDPNLMLAIVGGGIAIATIGYCDDVYTVKVRWRIITHFLAAVWAIYWLHGFAILDLGTWTFTLNTIGSFFAIICIMWCINLYNFMDGIDGLAGSEGIFISLAGSLALWLTYHHSMAFLMLLLAAAIAGFTVWNWPPAKIFLGDIGSGYLGYIFAVLSIYTANQGFVPIVFWIIVLAIFLCDTTFTLIGRAFQGKRWYAAHREHAYQNLISYGASHQHVTVCISMGNICIVLPLAFIALYQRQQAFWLLGSLLVALFFAWSSIKSKTLIGWDFKGKI